VPPKERDVAMVFQNVQSPQETQSSASRIGGIPEKATSTFAFTTSGAPSAATVANKNRGTPKPQSSNPDATVSCDWSSAW